MKRYVVFGVLAFLSLASGVPAQPTGNVNPPAPVALPVTLPEAAELLGGPTVVTLHLKDASAQTVLEALSKQSGVPLRLLFNDEAVEAPKYNIDIEKQPFWTALLEVCRQLQLSPQLAGDRIIQDLLPGNPDDAVGGLVSTQPMITLTAREMRHEHTFSLKADKGNLQPQQEVHAIYFNGWILSDPKFRVAPNTMVNVDITEAVDDKGQELGHEQAGASFVQSPVLWDLQINLDGRTETGKKLTRLKGILKAFIITKSERWELNDLAHVGPVTKTVKTAQGTETYQLADLAQVGKQYEVTFAVSRPAQQNPPPDEDINVQQLRNARQDLGSFTRLLDAQGRDVPYLNSKVDGDNVTLTFSNPIEDANAAGLPAKLVMDIPLEFRELQVPFEFKDVPLP